MGLCSSSILPVVGKAEFIPNSKPGQDDACMSDLVKIGLSKSEIDHFYNIFQQMDIAGTGLVDLEQFYRYFRLDRSPYADRVFSVLDVDGSGSISFRSFVLCLFNFCSLDHRALLRFSFSMFDASGTGKMSLADLERLVAFVYGAKMSHPQIASIITETKKITSDITFDLFTTLNKRYSNLLLPAHSLQETLREHVLGHKFWVQKFEDMVKNGHYSVWDVLQAIDMGTVGALGQQDRISTSNRYVPDYLPEGSYIPAVEETAALSVAKAMNRRQQLESQYDGSKRRSSVVIVKKSEDDDNEIPAASNTSGSTASRLIQNRRASNAAVAVGAVGTPVSSEPVAPTAKRRASIIGSPGMGSVGSTGHNGSVHSAGQNSIGTPDPVAPKAFPAADISDPSGPHGVDMFSNLSPENMKKNRRRSSVVNVQARAAAKADRMAYDY